METIPDPARRRQGVCSAEGRAPLAAGRCSDDDGVMQSPSIFWLVGAVAALLAGLAIGALLAVSGWRHVGRRFLGRDAGPSVPTLFLIGPGIAALFLLMLAFGLFRQWMGWADDTITPPTADAWACDDEALIAASGLAALCIGMAWRAVVRDRQTAATTPTPIAALSDGPVRIVGIVEALPGVDGIRSPLSGIECLAVRSTLTHEDDEATRILVDFTGSAAFGVRDATGLVQVQPAGAAFQVPPTLRWRRQTGLSGDRRSLAALASDGTDPDRFAASLQARYSAWRRRRIPGDPVETETAVHEAHRQALDYLAAMQTAGSVLDAEATRFEERAIVAGDPVAVLGRFDPVGGHITAGPGVPFTIASDSASIDAIHRRRLPTLAWAAGAVVALVWLADELGCL